jgi:hypothetical protein
MHVVFSSETLGLGTAPRHAMPQVRYRNVIASSLDSDLTSTELASIGCYSEIGTADSRGLFCNSSSLAPGWRRAQKELTPDFVANTLVDSCVLCHSAAFRAVALEIDLF